MDEVMDEVSEGIKGGDKLELSDTVKVNGEMNGACDESMEVSDTLSKSPVGEDGGNEDEPANDDSSLGGEAEVDAEDVDAADVDAADIDAADVDAEDVDASDVDAADVNATDVEAADVSASAVPNNKEVDGEDELMEVDSDAREVPNKECDTSSSEVPHTSIDKSDDNLKESLNNGPSAQSSSNVNSEVDGDKVDEEDSIQEDEEEELEDTPEKEPKEDGDIGSEQSDVSDKKVDNESSEKESNCEQNIGNSESDEKTSENDRTLQNGGAATPDGSEDPKSSEKADDTIEEMTPEKDDSNGNKEEDGGDGEESTPTKKGKGKKKVEPVSVTLTPRRSSRNLNKQKSYVEDKDDLPEKDDGSDIEEITMVDPLAVSSDLTRENKENSKARNSRGGPNKTIVVNDTKHLVEIASGSSKSPKGVKKEPTLVIIDTNSILSGRGPIPAQQQHTLHKPPQRSQLQITPAHPIHSTTITQSYSVVPDTWHQQQPPSHSSSSSNSPRIPASSTITPVKPPIILPSLTDDMYVVEAPSFIVPYVYEKPPVKSLKDFIEALQDNIKAAKEAEQNRKEEAEKNKKEEAEKSKKEDEEKEKEREEKEKKVDEDKETAALNKEKEGDKEKAGEEKEEVEKKKAGEEKEQSDEEKKKEEAEKDEEEGDALAKKDEEPKKEVEGKEGGADKEVEACEKSKDISEETDKTKEDDNDGEKKKSVDDQAEDVPDKDEKSKDEASKKTSNEEEEMEIDDGSTKEKVDSKDVSDDSKEDVLDKEKADDKESKKEKDGDKEDQVNGKEDSKEDDKEGEDSSKIEKAVEDSKKEEVIIEKEDKKEESKDKKPDAEASGEKKEETAKDVKVVPSEKGDVKPDGEAKDSPKSEESKKPTSYFENPLGKFFIQIGINLVQEYVQTDLLRSQKKKREREGGKGGVTTQMAISSLEQTLEFSKENNEPFHLKQKKCDFCNFKTESALVMAHHMETPHMRNYVYRCNFCPMEVRSPHDILFHMEAEHNVRGRLERGPAFHQCPSCSFEDNQKGKLTRHLVSCQKRYRPEKNQEPPLDWEPPAKIPRVSRNRPGFPMAGGASPGVPGIPGVTKTPPMMGQPHPLLPKLGPGATLMGQTTLGAVGTIGRGRGRPPMQGRYVPDMKQAQVIQQQVPRPMSAQTLRQGMLYRPSGGPQSQVLLPTSYHIGNQIYQVVGGQFVGGMPVAMSSQGGLMTNVAASSIQNAAGKVQTKAQQQPSISITPLPRQTTVTPPNAHSASMTGIKPGHPGGGKATFVICEICDGYIKDLEQLRSHMQWIHKVKIHPKMIFNRPPLNCQKCQFRFFTDQGLERHLLGSHGLVTSSMQEAANKGKDGGRCPVCGRVYQWKLLNHVARDHSMTLKPAHLSYKCTVCTATFGMYKQFENHVYTAHSVVAKRVMEKKPGAGGAGASSGGSSSQGVAGRPVTAQRPTAATPQGESLLKPLKINDEITIIPQPARARPGTTGRPSSSPAHAQTKVGAEDRERASRPKDGAKDGAEVIDLEGAAGKDALSAVQERLRRRTSLEVSQVEPEQPPNKKSRKD